MILLDSQCIILIQPRLISVVRHPLACTQVAHMKQWRVSKGLSANRNAEGILTDGPDYTFLDGRPTPLLVG